MSPILLVLLFVVSAVLGYVIIRNVPALLHTPLMSGMNALSGVTVLGAMVAAGAAAATNSIAALIVALAAAALAIINVAGGFALTHKMLSSFVKKKGGTDHE
ncbi:MAG: NAD(P) transhydrogenase subunit alpha [Oscillospiraceae bacterium]|nr:NAD(P) transhydrogenase subunit alpha [Oscillospiraceae bacterium]